MATKHRRNATIADLYKVPCKAEIANGKIVYLPPKGDMPSHAQGEIFVSLRLYSKAKRFGTVTGSNHAFCVNLPRRLSFSPDTALFLGPSPGWNFFEGAPIFAVEVRGELDYGCKNEKRRADKRADYFAAGTFIVWDVDLLSNDVVKSYHAENPEQPLCFQRGQIANAEPAVPGWSMPVDDLFYTEPA